MKGVWKWGAVLGMMLLGVWGAQGLSSEKVRYVVGVDITDSTVDLSMTFGSYLNTTVGTLFSPPITFSVVPLRASKALPIAAQAFDFIYTSPHELACLESSLQATPLGGVVMARATDDSVQVLRDISQKRVITQGVGRDSPYLLVTDTLMRSGLDVAGNMLFDLAGDWDSVRTAVLEGRADVGVVQTGVYEAAGAGLKVVGGIPSSAPHADFPFATSTLLVPNWGLAHVGREDDEDVNQQVLFALLLLNSSSSYAIAGGYAGFDVAHSYAAMMRVNNDLGLVYGSPPTCTTTPPDPLSAPLCPPPLSPLPPSRALCPSCPPTYSCVCNACAATPNTLLSYPGWTCSSNCAPTTKGDSYPILTQCVEYDLVLKDLGLREGANFSVVIEDGGGGAWNGQCSPRADGECHFTYTFREVGRQYVRVFLNGSELAGEVKQVLVYSPVCGKSAPSLIYEGEGWGVVDRNRDSVYTTDDDCTCACRADAYFCSTSGVGGGIAVIVIVTLVPIILVLCCYMSSIRAKRATWSWAIPVAELQIPENPEVLNTGTFGFVIKAQYCGTSVAVKRIVPADGDMKDFISQKTTIWGGAQTQTIAGGKLKAVQGAAPQPYVPSSRNVDGATFTLKKAGFRGKLLRLFYRFAARCCWSCVNDRPGLNRDNSAIINLGELGDSQSGISRRKSSVADSNYYESRNRRLSAAESTVTGETVSRVPSTAEAYSGHRRASYDVSGPMTTLHRPNLPLTRSGPNLARASSSGNLASPSTNHTTVKRLLASQSPQVPILGRTPQESPSSSWDGDDNRQSSLLPESVSNNELPHTLREAWLVEGSTPVSTHIPDMSHGIAAEKRLFASTSTAVDNNQSRSIRSHLHIQGVERTISSIRRGAGSVRTVFGEKAAVMSAKMHLMDDFKHEMNLLFQVRHPCIVGIVGAVLEDGIDPLLVMELCENGSLYDMIHNRSVSLEPEIVVPILGDVVQGMKYLHSLDPPIVHGDLRAAKILVDSTFRGKICDFGLDQKRSLGLSAARQWMAPEYLLNGVASLYSDVYAFGVLIFEIFARQEPYEGEDVEVASAEVMDVMLDPPKIPGIPEGCPESIVELMLDCWERDIVRRPPFEVIETRISKESIAVRDMFKPGDTTTSDRVEELNTNVLYDVFPKHVAEQLLQGKKVEPEHKACVTVYFSDIIGFQDIAREFSPEKVSEMLDRLYTRFDQISTDEDVFKVETIGDSYMAVTNLVKDQSQDHCARIARFALRAIKAANETALDLADLSKGYVSIRVGFSIGPIVANVVGSKNPRFCLFGDTVNTSSRMESNSAANRIHCTKQAADLLREQAPGMDIEGRGQIMVKGKGLLTTYWVNGENVQKTSEELAQRQAGLGHKASLTSPADRRRRAQGLATVNAAFGNAPKVAAEGRFKVGINKIKAINALARVAIMSKEGGGMSVFQKLSKRVAESGTVDRPNIAADVGTRSPMAARKVRLLAGGRTPDHARPRSFIDSSEGPQGEGDDTCAPITAVQNFLVNQYIYNGENVARRSMEMFEAIQHMDTLAEETESVLSSHVNTPAHAHKASGRSLLSLISPSNRGQNSPAMVRLTPLVHNASPVHEKSSLFDSRTNSSLESLACLGLTPSQGLASRLKVEADPLPSVLFNNITARLSDPDIDIMHGQLSEGPDMTGEVAHGNEQPTS